MKIKAWDHTSYLNQYRRLGRETEKRAVWSRTICNGQGGGCGLAEKAWKCRQDSATVEP